MALLTVSPCVTVPGQHANSFFLVELNSSQSGALSFGANLAVAYPPPLHAPVNVLETPNNVGGTVFAIDTQDNHPLLVMYQYS